MVGKGRAADLHPGIHDARRIEDVLDRDEEAVELLAEHPTDVFRTDTPVAMLAADRSAKTSQDRLMNGMVAFDHAREVVLVVDVQQGNNVRIAVSDVSEDGHRYALSAKEFFEIPDQFADPLRADDHVVHIVDRF